MTHLLFGRAPHTDRFSFLSLLCYTSIIIDPCRVPPLSPLLHQASSTGSITWFSKKRLVFQLRFHDNTVSQHASQLTLIGSMYTIFNFEISNTCSTRSNQFLCNIEPNYPAVAIGGRERERWSDDSSTLFSLAVCFALCGHTSSSGFVIFFL